MPSNYKSSKGQQQNIWLNYQVPCNEYISAYIVFSEPWKDLHRHVIFLSPQYGLLSAFLYGAVSKRNHMRATVQSFSFGQLNLKKNRRGAYSLQISDWQLEAPSIVLSPPLCTEVYQHAALWSELLLYSHGLGHYSDLAKRKGKLEGQCESASLFAELRSLLSSVLHFASPEHCRLATLRFFWQFLLLEGFQPGLSQCYSCNQALSLLTEEVFFSVRSELLCARCARAHSGRFLGSDELNVMCWAEQDLASFVRQDEFFFGQRYLHYSGTCSVLLSQLESSIESLLGRRLRSSQAF